MQGSTSSATEAKAAGTRVVAIGIAAVVLILTLAGVFLLLNLPDANAFNARVEQLFIENDDLTKQNTKLKRDFQTAENQVAHSHL